MDYCQEHGIAMNRRPTGGGAILMGEDQLGVALAVPDGSGDPCGGARAWMKKFSAGLVAALRDLGLGAEFRRKNDIEVSGRKIAGLGVCRVPTGGLLFHASLLVDLDVPLMLRVLNTPFEKIRDKEIAWVAARTTTVRRELGKEISLDEVRREVAAGYSAVFNVGLQASDFTPEESQAIAQMERDKYLARDWVFQTTDVNDAAGAAKVKTPAGLLDLKVTLAGRRLKAVLIAGDFFAPEVGIAALEAALRWHSSAPEQVVATLQEIYAAHPGLSEAVPLAGLAEAIELAVQSAALVKSGMPGEPYGCFVVPESAHG